MAQQYSELMGLISRMKGLMTEIEACVASKPAKLSKDEYLEKPPEEREKIDEEEVMSREEKEQPEE